MPCFSLAVTEGQMSIRTAEVRPYYFFFFDLAFQRLIDRVTLRLALFEVSSC